MNSSALTEKRHVAASVHHDSRQPDLLVSGGVDEAHQFLAHTAPQDDNFQALSLKLLRRRIDWRIVPLLFLVYTMNLIDKVALNYAAVMGLNKDLKLKGNEFSNTATIFFAAYLIAEIPTAFILNKFPAGKFLGASVVLWGIATACTAAAHSYKTLLAARIVLGIFEAPVAPCMMLISSQWYTKSEQSPRFAFWYCGLGIGQIVGGSLSYAFQHIVNPTFSGWRIMFVVLGCVTVVLGFATIFLLPDAPMTASFLSAGEKKAVLHHVSVNQTGVLNKQINLAQIWDAVTDMQLWLLMAMTILPSISSGVVTSYSATLIRNFGYSPPSAALLNMPSGVVSIASSLIVGHGVRRTSHRWAWYIGCCIPGIIGGALMSFSAKHNQAAHLAGIYMVNCIVPTVLIAYQLTAANVAGPTKRAVATSLMAAAFGVGNIAGPSTFKARDAPDYIPAKITVLATQGAAAGVAVLLFPYYVWINARRRHRDASKNEAEETEQVAWSGLTDREKPFFLYTY